MIRDDIALDIKEYLGDKYRLYIDNNAGEFLNIEKNMTPQKQLDMLRDKITCVFKTTVGEIVALKDLFSSSCAFSLEFYVPTGTDVYTDIESLIDELNGSLQDRDEYRYIITFNTPYLAQNIKLQNGQYYTIVAVTGNISYSNESLFFNDLEICIDDITLKGVINASIKTSIVSEEKAVAGEFYPQIISKYAQSNLHLTLHMRKDDEAALILMGLTLNPGTAFYKKVTIKSHYKVNGSVPGDVVWARAKIIDLQTDASIGGYVIQSVVLQRVANL